MKRHREEEHLDFVYGLLNVTYKKEIPRTEIKTFAELLERGRHLESLAKEAGEVRVTQERKPLNRCSFCGKKGHLSDVRVCRKRLAEQKAASEETSKTPDITCCVEHWQCLEVTAKLVRTRKPCLNRHHTLSFKEYVTFCQFSELIGLESTCNLMYPS
ncbi:hypothetical protein B5X24_HaOG215371 [Helicoverpa armigera]|nr:hypothetical protein B5X24_HaOG215371 [Helicoverpa armigera]